MSYQKILVAVDFSKHSLKALKHAQLMAEAFKSEVELIHVTEIPVYPILEDVAVTGLPGLWDEGLIEDIVSASDSQLKHLAEQGNISNYRTIVGVPSSEIVSIAESNHINLIVMGFHGASGFSRLIGSTTHSVINDAPCDVLAVKLESD